jgi:uncharacterized protein YjiS (DUF1127 family)
MQHDHCCHATFAIFKKADTPHYRFGRVIINKGNTEMNLRNRIQKWRQYRHNLSELQLCTDRDLADLGIARADIRRIAWQACS